MKILFTAAPNFLFVNQEVHLEKTVPPSSIYALAAVLVQNGYETDVLDPHDFYYRYRKDSKFEELLRQYDVLCMSANTITWPVALWMIEQALQVQSCRIILGGVHASYCDEHIMRRAPVDVIVRGEGEKTLVDVIHAIEAGAPLNEIPGITFRVGQQIVRNPDRPPLSQRELDGQALPLWDRVPEGVYCFFPVELSRGCRYACNFCSIYHKRNRRGYSWPVIRERIDQGIKMLPKFKYKTLMFSDDCFTSDPWTVKQVADYLNTIAPEIEVGIEARANEILHPEVIGSLGKMNVGFLQIGVECGYRDGLKRVGKGIKLSQVIQTTQKLHSLGIAKKVKYSYIIGFPWETMADMKRTIAFAMHLASDLGNMVQINWYMLSPGNEVFRELYGRKLVFLYDFDSWNEHDHSLFFRSHPTLSLEMYNEIREFAGHLERTYPWVSVLGNVFRSSDHPHLATDITIPGPQIPYWTGRWPIFEPSSLPMGGLIENLT